MENNFSLRFVFYFYPSKLPNNQMEGKRKFDIKKHTSDNARILRSDNASVRPDEVLFRRRSFNLLQNSPKYQ